MFLNTLPFAATRLRIHIPSWNRAPLGLGDKTSALLVRSDNPDRPHTERHDFILTAFDPRTWGDLWTLSMQLLDAPGQFSRLIDLLDSLAITVLASESRQSYREQFFSISLLLDCTQYDYDVDKDSAARVANASANLLALHALIFSEFVCELRLVGHSHPRLLIQRNWSHYDLYRDFLSPNSPVRSQSSRDKYLIPIRIGDGGWIDFPPPLTELLKNTIKWRAYVSTNIRARLIHITLASKKDHLTLSMVFYFDRSDDVLSHILEALRQKYYNILRHQLRPFLLAADDKLAATLPPLRQPYTLNVLLESLDGGILSDKQRCDELHAKIIEICKHDRVTVVPVPIRKPFASRKS